MSTARMKRIRHVHLSSLRHRARLQPAMAKGTNQPPAALAKRSPKSIIVQIETALMIYPRLVMLHTFPRPPEPRNCCCSSTVSLPLSNARRMNIPALYHSLVLRIGDGTGLPYVENGTGTGTIAFITEQVSYTTSVFAEDGRGFDAPDITRRQHQSKWTPDDVGERMDLCGPAAPRPPERPVLRRMRRVGFCCTCC